MKTINILVGIMFLVGLVAFSITGKLGAGVWTIILGQILDRNHKLVH